jgi:hypothetical protein
MSEPSIERIEAALAALGQEYRSPAGWEDRVRAATRRRRPGRWAAIGALVAAAAALLLWWSGVGRRSEDSLPPFEYEFAGRGADVRVRGESKPRPGDTLRATVRGGKHRAMWLYRGEELVHHCPGDDGCAASDRVTSLEAALELLGSYTLIELRHDARIPEPTGSLDEDLAAAQRAGASTRPHPFVVE